MAPDRRMTTRRDVQPERALVVTAPQPNFEELFPHRWPYLVLTLMMAVGVGMVTVGERPGVVTTITLLAAVAIASLVGRAHRFAGHASQFGRIACTFAVVITPLLLFGFGMTQWAVQGNLPWDVAGAGLLGVGAIAAAYLRRQPGMILAAQFSIWSSAIISGFSLAGIAALLAAAVLAIFVNREQLAEQSSEQQLRAAQERAQTRARDILSDYEGTRQGWFWETDRRSLLTYVSGPVAESLGLNSENLIGQPLVQLFNLDVSGDESQRTLMFHLSARSAFKELPVRAANGREELWWSVSGRPIYDSFNNFVGFRGSGTDLTERRRSQEEASRLAKFDSLTGLANRFQITQALEKILTSQQVANRECAVLLLDLDRFKQVNDTMGHPAGDALLKQVAKRLERAVGKMGQVGRLGGDEFKVIVPGRNQREILADLAREIIHALSQPYAIDGQRVVIGVSIGIALAPEDGETSDDLIRNGDLALYAAKDAGRGRYHFYAEDLHAEAEARAQMEEDLRDAIAKGDLQVYYQPVICTATEKIAGFEALLRWHHPVKGWIPPSRFIQTAEDTGLIAQLGEWALRTACHDMAKMPEDVRVAVNVSPLQFSSPNLPGVVTSALAQAGVCADRLELEITESVFLSDDEGTDAMFAALKQIGVRLALDDFGTGYSSLGYLKKAPFDKIKIDQSFVRGATQEGSRNGAIIASITSLAHALGMETTAEGVETLDELELVRMHGCSHVQGYIYERPLNAEAALERLESGLAAIANGPRSARAPRQSMLRRVVLDHCDTLYNGTIRNISTTGALIEGLWNVPDGTVFKLQISQDYYVACTSRWCEENKMGVEFANPLQRDAAGRILAVLGASPQPVVNGELKKAS
ncbi:EAL domain-containing protein [Altererythrobacter aestuarii]|uniref:EAL domain-containing protein n=2 Tax=Alteraurantiacibacter aestuarii TaxID=650004 RepID=A0A844ZIP3_9SPHN|nr:EAL domain-containing protein [Alteraurantiacibacter aestuarii]MXO87658.1 EAL domain-containing protein [Alteraurantiacibacter aestuarii]